MFRIYHARDGRFGSSSQMYWNLIWKSPGFVQFGVQSDPLWSQTYHPCLHSPELPDLPPIPTEADLDRCPDTWHGADNICYKKLPRTNYAGAKSECTEAGGTRLVGPSVDKDVLKELGYLIIHFNCHSYSILNYESYQHFIFASINDWFI